MSLLTLIKPVVSLARGGRLLGALALLWLAAPAPARAQTWMVSTTAHVTLGVLDKYGQLGAYTATFVVRSERTGKEYQLVKSIEKGQNGADVLFPSEATTSDYFKASTGEAPPAAPGRYTWECRVNGKKAVGGHFALPEVGNDVTVIEKDKP
ncbi:hypothetical protein ACFQ48_01535 [Hymenobacter caeli]|uniref:EfeO-type cupredoxin-like domain-containing protein n=1 Tax=Hymenobacter caeli TaxID=2735894 RepID=A0ABX2FK52_9BACT|nr:hypothetical protein [Hymenobacter caeli]NRT17503.1 hypothetical protein [Hymenobacter caeli]